MTPHLNRPDETILMMSHNVCFNEEIWLITVQILCIGTDRSHQTVQTKIRLLLKKQSDQGLRCLPFHPHPFGCINAMLRQTSLFLGQFWQLFEVSHILEFLGY